MKPVKPKKGTSKSRRKAIKKVQKKPAIRKVELPVQPVQPVQEPVKKAVEEIADPGAKVEEQGQPGLTGTVEAPDPNVEAPPEPAPGATEEPAPAPKPEGSNPV